MLRYIWDKFGDIINFLLENSGYFIFIGLIFNIYFQEDIHKQIISLVLAIGFLIINTKQELIKYMDKKNAISDSPTPQNWVYYEVDVRGNGMIYKDYVIVMKHTTENPYKRIKDFYKDIGQEVLDINIHFISKRI